MSLELPILRIGLAGFSLEQQEQLSRILAVASSSGMTWEFAKFGDADAIWINGARTQVTGEGTLRVASGVPTGRSIQINLPDVDRPVVFAHAVVAGDLLLRNVVAAGPVLGRRRRPVQWKARRADL